jgi:carbon storage regulator CsrA
VLLLNRKVEERIIIKLLEPLPAGTEISVLVAEIRPAKVRLGFTADKRMSVHREEIQRRIDAELLQHNKKEKQEQGINHE